MLVNMHKMTNSIQNYSWGSYNALTKLFGITNTHKQPMAELWMGAHPKNPSYVTDSNSRLRSLNELINEDPTKQLGANIAKRFGELPFLVKVLCVEQPLSIQVHHSKTAATTGYAKENAARIPLDAEERSCKDPNHKPELVFALTHFLAMNSFRTLDDIVSLLHPIADAHQDIPVFLDNPDIAHLSKLFASIFAMSTTQKSRALSVLNIVLNQKQGQPWDTIRFIANFYPLDSGGLFSPLLLNLVQLEPGEAMFLHVETPHAYLQGVALEVMANSDNVLRAGLTQKFINLPELLANLQFYPRPVSTLLIQPKYRGNELFFPIPVEDFAFSLHKLSATPQLLAQNSAAIIFCVTGEAVLEKEGQKWILKPGRSCFISAFESPVNASGHGSIARIYNQIL